MNVWENAVITKKGLSLLSKMVEGNTLYITKAEAGSGYVTPGLLDQQTSVSIPMKSLSLRTASYPEEGKCKLPCFLTNDGVPTGFTAKQVGIYATDPDEGEILFFIAQAASGTGTEVPSESEMLGYSAEWTFYFQYGQASAVNVTIDPANTVTREEMEGYVSEAIGNIKIEVDSFLIETSENPIQNKVVANELKNVYKKGEVCTPATLGLFGCDTPNDILRNLGSHWWKKSVVEKGERIVEEAKTARIDNSTGLSTNAIMATYYYADSYTLSKEGYELVNPRKFDLNYTSGNIFTTNISGRYFMQDATTGNSMYYGGTLDGTGNPNCNLWNNTTEGIFGVTITGVTNYFCYVKTYETLGEIEFVSSSNPDAYPTGYHDIFRYDYLGVPFENAIQGAKFETGFYIGGGTMSQMELTFNFIPRMVIVSALSNKVDNATDVYYTGIFLQGVPMGIIVGVVDHQPGNIYKAANATWDGKVLRWNCPNNAWINLDIAGIQYNTFAIG